LNGSLALVHGLALLQEGVHALVVVVTAAGDALQLVLVVELGVEAAVLGAVMIFLGEDEG